MREMTETTDGDGNGARRRRCRFRPPAGPTATLRARTRAGRTRRADVSLIQNSRLVHHEEVPPAAFVGTPVKFEITITNDGESTARDIVVTDKVCETAKSAPHRTAARTVQPIVWNLGGMTPASRRRTHRRVEAPRSPTWSARPCRVAGDGFRRRQVQSGDRRHSGHSAGAHRPERPGRGGRRRDVRDHRDEPGLAGRGARSWSWQRCRSSWSFVERGRHPPTIGRAARS